MEEEYSNVKNEMQLQQFICSVMPQHARDHKAHAPNHT